MALFGYKDKETRLDDYYKVPSGQTVLYFAGGCFWGAEKAFKQLKGVTETKVGYANGHVPNPYYELVCRTETGYKETVRVTFDPKITPLATLLKAYFMCIHPEQEDGQGFDIGTQYHTGIYYREDYLPDKEMKEQLITLFEEEKARHARFYTELKPLLCFYEAEEYHQDYLTKNPTGYCHITFADIEAVKALNTQN